MIIVLLGCHCKKVPLKVTIGYKHKPFSSSILLYSSFLSFSPSTNLALRFSCNSASCFTVENKCQRIRFAYAQIYKFFIVLVMCPNDRKIKTPLEWMWELNTLISWTSDLYVDASSNSLICSIFIIYGPRIVKMRHNIFAIADSFLKFASCTFNFLVKSLNEENHLLFSLTCPSTANARYKKKVLKCQLSGLQWKM